MISVIIPTFSEEKNISSLLDHLSTCIGIEEMEIIVCDSPLSTDNGFQVAKDRGVITLKSPKGYRAFQMNYGAKYAQHDILYFLHADARPPCNFIESIKTAIENGCDFGIFSYKFNSNHFLLKINSFFTRYDGWFAGGGDQSLFMRKSVFLNLNGFDEGLKIMEDFDIFKRAKKSEFKYDIINNPLIVSSRKYDSNSWLKVNLINLCIYLLYLFNGRQEKMIELNKRLI